jgi:hypothetical protein
MNQNFQKQQNYGPMGLNGGIGVLVSITDQYLSISRTYISASYDQRCICITIASNE